MSLSQSLLTNKGPCHMEAPLVCTIHGANLIIHIISLRPFGSLAIPNETIPRCPGGQHTNPNNVAKTINGNRILYTQPAYFGLKWTPQRMPPIEAIGMLGRDQNGYITHAFSGSP